MLYEVITIDIAAGESRPLPEVRPNIPHVVILGINDAVAGRDMLEVEMAIPDEEERLVLWARYLGQSEPAQRAAAALLSGPVIRRLARNAQLLAEQSLTPVNDRHIAQSRRDFGAERLRLLAQPVTQEVHREAVVFPPLVEENLDHLV